VAKHKLVCFNINPYLVEDKRFEKFISFYDPYTIPEKIGLELTERTAIVDFATFFNRLKLFKKKGFKISIDDIGSGYASLNSVVELKPEFIKIDIHLIHNIHIDSVRQNLIKALVMFCKQSEITSIAEGVERQEELEKLIELGVDAGQGYLLGKPRPEVYI
jgi:EAL domain-containing protein (putative c-di-GMP-specific phosphodiesterase class I)